MWRLFVVIAVIACDQITNPILRMNLRAWDLGDQDGILGIWVRLGVRGPVVFGLIGGSWLGFGFLGLMGRGWHWLGDGVLGDCEGGDGYW